MHIQEGYKYSRIAKLVAEETSKYLDQNIAKLEGIDFKRQVKDIGKEMKNAGINLTNGSDIASSPANQGIMKKQSKEVS
jgi:hypothetical protein